MNVSTYNLMKKGNACTLRESSNYETIIENITSPRCIMDFCNEVFGMKDLSSEKLIVVCTNGKSAPKAVFEFSGGYDYVGAPAGLILTGILLTGCFRFFIAHNHPSGNSRPSMEDDNFTQNLSKCAKMLGIDLLDHVIIGDGNYYSYKENDEI